MRCLALLLCIWLMCDAAICGAAEKQWSQYRGPDGAGHSAATNLPVTFGEQENVKWKTPLDGKAWSSPVVWDNQVWLSNATPDGTRLSAVALDLESGKILHNITAFEIEKPQFCHAFNSHASSTPAIEAGRIYVHFGSSGTACIDTSNGQILWKRQDLPCDHFRGAGSSPVIFGDLLIVCFDGADVQYVVALNKKTGETVWKKDRAFDYKTTNGDNKKGYGTPTVVKLAGRDQAICPAAMATESFDAHTGELLWTVRHDGMNASSPPLLGNGLVYLTNGMGKMVAVKPEGSGELPVDAIVWSSGKGVSKRSAPVLVGDLLFMVTDDGIGCCVDALTGKPHWSKRLGGEYASSPILADGKLYFANMSGEVTVLAPAAEYKELAKNKFADGFMASPAVAGNSLIYRTTKAVYRIAK